MSREAVHETLPAMRLLLCALLLLGACKKTSEVAPAPTIDAMTPPAATPRDASSPDASTKLGAAPNLLDLVPAKVAVSSTVDNPRDFPEFLVDGKPETAWNGKTGDLVGGSISFRVPADVKVEGVEMTAGYDRTTPKADLFTANHRITSVEVLRDGKSLGSYSLDPSLRGLQRIAVAGPGGDWQIKVLATFPGTESAWKELVVSELRVVGTPGAARRDPTEPLRVVVGSLDREPKSLPIEAREITEVYPAVAPYCAKQLAAMAAQRPSLEGTARENNLTIRPASCTQVKEVKLSGDYPRALVMNIANGINAHETILVEVARGLVPVPEATWDSGENPLDPGCMSIVRFTGPSSIRVESGHFVVAVNANRGTYGAGGEYKTVALTEVVWCKEASGKLACKEYDPRLHPLLDSFGISPKGDLLLLRSKANPFADP